MFALIKGYNIWFNTMLWDIFACKKIFPGEREWSHVNKLTNQKQFWFLLSGGKNASFLTFYSATTE